MDSRSAALLATACGGTSRPLCGCTSSPGAGVLLALIVLLRLRRARHS
jgi:uncharacterized protein (TIGR03382 family)